MEKEVIQEMRIDEIDKEIITRFNQYGFVVTTLDHKFTGNKTTHYYVINAGSRYFCESLFRGIPAPTSGKLT